jgi:hypothetical protein
MQKLKFPKLLQSLGIHKIQFLMLYIWYFYNINFSSTIEVNFVSVTDHENNFLSHTFFQVRSFILNVIQQLGLQQRHNT